MAKAAEAKKAQPSTIKKSQPTGIPWPHAPVHMLAGAGTFIVTSGTYNKAHIFKDGPLLRMLHTALLTIAAEHLWQLEAWAVFPNHYHFIGHSPERADSLARFLNELHARTARSANRFDGTAERKVWHNFWETRLTYEHSYFARLNYVHQNPIKHGLVSKANQYPYRSAAWFERTASQAQIRTIASFKIDRLKIVDDF